MVLDYKIIYLRKKMLQKNIAECMYMYMYVL